ncbi:MAG: SDR family NAD(P)-dependent oxidoreductase [Spirosomataceae bacterium]
MRLKDKVALITGGSSGIGRETALLFVQEGCAVVLADVNDSAGIALADEITEKGGQAIYVRADVSKAADCENMIATAEKAMESSTSFSTMRALCTLTMTMLSD